MIENSRQFTALRWLGLAAALLLLNASLAFASIWPTLIVRLSSEFSLEVALCVLALVGIQRWGTPSPRALRWVAGIWVVLVLGHYIDVTTRALYGRDINLYWDLRLMPNVGAMFAVVAKPWLIALVIGGLVLVPVILYLPLKWAITSISDAAAHVVPRRVLAVLSLAVLVVFAAEKASGVPEEEGVRFSHPITWGVARELGELAYEASGAGVRALPPAPSMESNFSRLDGADVFLIFMESYGAVSWDHPELATPLRDSRARLDDDIRASGGKVVSAFVESTTFGGESWLAHISLLSGTEVRDQGTNVRLMAQDRDTLVKAFNRGGYRTVALMPGVQVSWPQGAFYGFNEIYDLVRLDYHGPPFGWWGITDQFALARLESLEVSREPRQPVFAFFPTISTHAPFTPAPPYQPDWVRVLTKKPFDADELDRAWSEQPDWTNLAPSYVQGLTYANATLGGFLRNRRGHDFVMVLLGDHQPPALVSGEGASWEVPVHVISTRPEVLDRLRSSGFRDGLAPEHPALSRVDQLLPMLLDAFGDSGTTTSATP